MTGVSGERGVRCDRVGGEGVWIRCGVGVSGDDDETSSSAVISTEG